MTSGQSHRWLALACLSALARACADDAGRPVAKTIDDKTGEGEVARSASSTTAACSPARSRRCSTRDAKPDAVCKECSDERKDKPIVGMTIIRGVKQAPTARPCGTAARSSTRTTAGSTRCGSSPIDGGRKLEVRGYIGAVLGRTQTWVRVE